MDISLLTPAERRFRVWMYLSAWMYGIAGTFFLVAGMRIAPFVNMVSERVLPGLAKYPQPEGAFWLVLSGSMMAMITWISRELYLDVRRNAPLATVLLLSKFCSTVLYIVFFIAHRQLVHVVGFLTDGPLFLVTAALWLPASTGSRQMTWREEEILAAVGEALLPRGGAFPTGYADVREACLTDAGRLLGAQHAVARFSTRMMLYVLNFCPLFVVYRPVTLKRMPLEARQELLRRIEARRRPGLRLLFFALKTMVFLPFFDREDVARSVGYVTEEGGA